MKNVWIFSLFSILSFTSIAGLSPDTPVLCSKKATMMKYTTELESFSEGTVIIVMASEDNVSENSLIFPGNRDEFTEEELNGEAFDFGAKCVQLIRYSTWKARKPSSSDND